MKQGKADEAKQFLAGALGKKYIDDRHCDAVEQLLDQLAMLCVRKKPLPAASPVAGAAPSPVAGAAPSPPAADGATAARRCPRRHAAAPGGRDAGTRPRRGTGRVARRVAELTARRSRRRASFTPRRQLARLRRQPAEADRSMLAIAAKFKPGRAQRDDPGPGGRRAAGQGAARRRRAVLPGR